MIPIPIISVVTAVLDGMDEHICETYESLVAQELPPGWSWQWVVQEDGETGRPGRRLPHDPRISLGMSRRSRAATARTMALFRVEGLLLRTLDADDLLPGDGALARDIDVLMGNPGIAWCVSPTLDLMPDGTYRPGPRDPDPGPLNPGFLADGLRNEMLPVVGTTLCTYSSLVRALGGWQALPAGEDVALMLAAEAVSDGWMQAAPGLIYRRWAMQSTSLDAHHDPEEAIARRSVLLERADMLRSCGWRWVREEFCGDEAEASAQA